MPIARFRGESLNCYTIHKDGPGAKRVFLALALAVLLLPMAMLGQAMPSMASAMAAAAEDDAGVLQREVTSFDGEMQAKDVPGKDVQSKRLFGVIPNYRADQKTTDYKPLTVAEKFKIAREDSFDWPNFPLLVGYTLQAQVTSRGFHQNGGLQGFGEFYARSFGDQIIGSYVTEAVLPSMLREDPRYFRSGTGNFWRRISYAASRVVVTRADSGSSRLFVSEVAGNAVVVAATSFYYPDSQSAAEGAERYAMQLGNDAVSNILTEFWPDIRIRLRFVRRYLFAH